MSTLHCNIIEITVLQYSSLFIIMYQLYSHKDVLGTIYSCGRPTQLLDELLVLVQLLESLNIHARQFVGLGFITMLLISKDAHPHLGLGDGPQPEVIKLQDKFSR